MMKADSTSGWHLLASHQPFNHILRYRTRLLRTVRQHNSEIDKFYAQPKLDQSWILIIKFFEQPTFRERDLQRGLSKHGWNAICSGQGRKKKSSNLAGRSVRREEEQQLSKLMTLSSTAGDFHSERLIGKGSTSCFLRLFPSPCLFCRCRRPLPGATRLVWASSLVADQAW